MVRSLFFKNQSIMWTQWDISTPVKLVHSKAWCALEGQSGAGQIFVTVMKRNFSNNDHNYGTVWSEEGAFSKGQTVFLECLTPNMKTLECLSMSGTTLPLTRHHIAEDFILQQQFCANVRSCILECNSAQTQHSICSLFYRTSMVIYFTGGIMVVHLTLLLLFTGNVIIGHGQYVNLEKSGTYNAAHAVKLPPCQACKVLVDSFKKVKWIL